MGRNRASIYANNDNNKEATHSSTNLCRFVSQNVFSLQEIKAGSGHRKYCHSNASAWNAARV